MEYQQLTYAIVTAEIRDQTLKKALQKIAKGIVKGDWEKHKRDKNLEQCQHMKHGTCGTVPVGQEKIKGEEKASPCIPFSIGNMSQQESQVIFRSTPTFSHAVHCLSEGNGKSFKFPLQQHVPTQKEINGEERASPIHVLFHT